jgi:hypothetical protein
VRQAGSIRSPSFHTDRAPFVTHDAAFGAVLGDAARLARVLATDAHEGPVYAPDEDALYFTTPTNVPTAGAPRVRLKLGPPKQHHGQSAVEHEEDGCAQDRTSNRVVGPDNAVLHGVGHSQQHDEDQRVQLGQLALACECQGDHEEAVGQDRPNELLERRHIELDHVVPHASTKRGSSVEGDDARPCSELTDVRSDARADAERRALATLLVERSHPPKGIGSHDTANDRVLRTHHDRAIPVSGAYTIDGPRLSATAPALHARHPRRCPRPPSSRRPHPAPNSPGDRPARPCTADQHAVELTANPAAQALLRHRIDWT